MTYTVLVLGGGQLARMMLPAAARLDIDLAVLDPHSECPACAGAARALQGDFAERQKVLDAVATIEPDAVTIEIEHVSTAAMAQISRGGIEVHPGARTVETVNDKLRQRHCLRDAGLPMPDYLEVPESSGDETEKPGTGDSRGAGRKELPALLGEFGLPAVQKLRFGGYDGRGVAMVSESLEELPLQGPSMLETRVDIARELSVLVARSVTGETAVYEPFEMEMDPELHLVRSVLFPASLEPATAANAGKIAVAAAEALSVVGVCAVELFLSTGGEILVNEVAPRPHNSGHLTLEASETDQFEQHLRAILGLPLGSTRMRGPAAMRNLVATGAPGPTVYTGVQKALGTPGAHLHLYGKRESRPGRKMGHLTACADSLAEAKRLAAQAMAALSVRGAAADAGDSSH